MVCFAIILANWFGGVRYFQDVPGGLIATPGPAFFFMTMVSLTAGSTFLMWTGEQITARGVGNGASLLIFTNIVVGLPRALGTLYSNTFITRDWSILQLLSVLVLMVLVVAFVVLVERAERRVPVQYAKRVLGRRVLAGHATHLPIKVNSAGVVPVIFASSMLSLPQSLAQSTGIQHVPWLAGILPLLQHGEPLYYLLFAVAVTLFTFLYVSIAFNPYETADNLRRFGGYVPGIRPGSETARQFDAILVRLTLVGAAYLILLCLIPDLMLFGIKLQHLPLVGNWLDARLPRLLLDGMNVNFAFGGTSLLIVVGVAMDLINQIEAQLVMRHYQDFQPRGRRRA